MEPTPEQAEALAKWRLWLEAEGYTILARDFSDAALIALSRVLLAESSAPESDVLEADALEAATLDTLTEPSQQVLAAALAQARELRQRRRAEAVARA